ELGIDAENIAEPLHIARLASGEVPPSSLADEYRKERMAKPNDLRPLIFLCDALVAAGQGDKVTQAAENWIFGIPEPARSQLGPAIRPVGSYMAGKLDQAAEQARSFRPMGSNPILAQSLAALGRAAEVAADPASEQLGDDPWTTLAVSLGLA